MTDTNELDKAILDAAEAYDEAWLAESLQSSLEGRRLHAAIVAKREALRPRLMDIEGAKKAYDDASGKSWIEWDPRSVDGLRAVLDADRASVLKVIEGLPQYMEIRDATGAWVLVRKPTDGLAPGTHVHIDDIRRVLSPSRGEA